MGKTIGIVSLKGGVGKTSITAALGDALASFGRKVLLIDGNMSAPNLGLHFNIIDPDVSLHHVLDRRAKPSDAVHNVGRFDIMPSSLFEKAISSPLKLKDRISALKNKYDVIILDSSPALNEETLGVMLASDEIIIVTTPDHPTLSNTMRAVRTARQRGTPIIGLILNKVHNKNFEISIKEIEDVVGVPVMAVIPYDTNVLKALSEFKTSVSHKPKSKGSQEYKKLAATILGEKYNTGKFMKFFGWMNPKKEEINRQIYRDEVFG